MSMNMADTARYVMLFAAWICVIEMVVFQFIYWKTIIPLRKNLKPEQRLVAPPVFWTAAYHAAVATLLVLMSIATILRIRQGGTVLPTTYGVGIVNLALVLIVQKFLAHYAHILKAIKEK